MITTAINSNVINYNQLDLLFSYFLVITAYAGMTVDSEDLRHFEDGMQYN